jgi:OOP family OmpA-OmpF porin
MKPNPLKIMILSALAALAALSAVGLGLAASGASASQSDGVGAWHQDARRPDGRDRGKTERRVEWWRRDDRRPAPWPKAGEKMMDADGDGVADADDRCPDTPAGVAVDVRGCPPDEDQDGVWDAKDRCPGTVRGIAVDAHGCPKDSDGDGVPDSLDKCPGTAAGARVDIKGCPLSTMETELLDTGKLRMESVYFDVNKATIKPESYPALDEAGQALSNCPDLRIEVGGHTDSSGDDGYNQKLSETRAKAVLDYLTSKFSSLHKDQYMSKGYGESQPVATNDTTEGRKHNRRVEFTVMNREVLRK